MKVALFTLFSLLCLQVSLAAYLPSAYKDDREYPLAPAKERFWDFGDWFTYENDNLELDKASPRFNPFLCFPAISEAGQLGKQGYDLLQKRQQLNAIREAGLQQCETYPNPTDRIKCSEAVEQNYQIEYLQVSNEIWNSLPKVFSTVIGLMKCIV